MRTPMFVIVPLLAAMPLSAKESALSGTWKQVKADDIAAAIDAIVSDMNFIKRPIARSRLAQMNPVNKIIVIAISDNDVLVKYDEREGIHMVPNVAAAPWTRDDGVKFLVAAQITKDQLIQSFKNEDSERTVLFKLSPDGKSLVMNVTIRNQQLPKPLIYSISFER